MPALFYSVWYTAGRKRLNVDFSTGKWSPTHHPTDGPVLCDNRGRKKEVGIECEDTENGTTTADSIIFSFLYLITVQLPDVPVHVLSGQSHIHFNHASAESHPVHDTYIRRDIEHQPSTPYIKQKRERERETDT